MAFAAIAQITAMAVFDQEIKKCLTTDFDRQGKCLRLVDPHQRRMNGDTLVEAVASVRLAIDEWIAEAVRLNRAVPAPTHKRAAH